MSKKKTVSSRISDRVSVLITYIALTYYGSWQFTISTFSRTYITNDPHSGSPNSSEVRVWRPRNGSVSRYSRDTDVLTHIEVPSKRKTRRLITVNTVLGVRVCHPRASRTGVTDNRRGSTGHGETQIKKEVEKSVL